MRDDDYQPSIYAQRAGYWNLGDAMNGKYRRATVTVEREPVFRGGVELRDVWVGYAEAKQRPQNERPATRLRYVMETLRLTYPELAKASRLTADDAQSGVCHTSILRLARNGSVPYRRTAQIGRMLRYINSALEVAGFAPVTVEEIFPLYDHAKGCSAKRYKVFVEDVTKWL